MKKKISKEEKIAIINQLMAKQEVQILKAELENQIDTMLLAWMEKESAEREQWRKDHDDRTIQHMRVVEDYLAGFNKLLGKKK